MPNQHVRRWNGGGVQKLMEVGNDFVSRMLHRELVAFPQAEAVVATDVCELLDLLLHGAPDFRSVVGSSLQNDAWRIRLSRSVYEHPMGARFN